MAYPASFTLGTGNKISVNYQSQEVHVSVTYQLEREDTDLLAVAAAKAPEVEQVHRLFWKQIREATNPAEEPKPKASRNGSAAPAKEPAASPEPPATASGAPPDGSEAPAETAPEASPNGASPNGHAESGKPAGGRKPEPKVTPPQIRALAALQTRQGMSGEDLKRRIEMRYGKTSVEELTELQATNLLLELQRNGRGQRPSSVAPTIERKEGETTNGEQTRRSPAAA